MQVDDNFTDLRYHWFCVGLVIVWIASGVSFTSAQTKDTMHSKTGTIVGHVVDDVTGEDLVGCNVLVGTWGGTPTDHSGHYVVQRVPAGMYRLKFTYIGYRMGTVDSVVVHPSDTVRIDYKLSVEDFGCESWADSARNDLAAGKVRIKSVGLIIWSFPKQEEKVRELTKKYGFEYDYAGCTFMCAGSYNEVVNKYLIARNGAEWQDRFMEEYRELERKNKR